MQMEPSAQQPAPAYPAKLYKYRKFDVRALNMVCNHGLYYSNPKEFNDPLDCELSIRPNISPMKMAKLLERLMGPEREDEWHQNLGWIIHQGTEDGGDIKVPGPARDYVRRALADYIGSEVRKDFDQRGVLSFSATWQSVLMWSHYADEHRGICLEFDTTELPHKDLVEVRYDGGRSVQASDIYTWQMENDEDAGARAFHRHFYSKAPDWHYEEEWREISPQPGPCGDYRITGVYFGYRCPAAVQIAIIRMLGEDTDVDLWDVSLTRHSFDLDRQRVDVDELIQMGMREPEGIEIARLIAEFDDLDAPTESGDGKGENQSESGDEDE